MLRSPTLFLPALVACALAFPLAACGDEEEAAQPAQTETQAAEPTETTEPPATTEPATGQADVEVGAARDLDSKPRIRRPSGDPPTALQTRDLVTGTGPAAAVGDTVSMQYVGVSYSSGEQFDASWDRNAEPFTFPLGAGQVIGGWDQGIVGMRKGGRRVLVIPPDLAYGPQGQPPDIGPDETLVFVVDLEQIG